MALVRQYSTLLTTSLFWGVSPAIIKLVANKFNYPLSIACSITSSAFLINYIILLYDNSLKWDKTYLLYGFLTAITHTVGAGIIITTVVSKLDLAVVSITIGSAPLLTYLAAYQLKYEQFLSRKMCGVIIGFIAIVALFYTDIDFVSSEWKWLLVALFCPILFTANNIFIRQWSLHHDNTKLLVFYTLGCGSIILLLLCWMYNSPTPFGYSYSHQIIGMLILLGFFDVFARVLFAYLIKTVNLSFATQAPYIAVIIGVLAGIFIHEEVYKSALWISMCLMVAALYLIRPIKQD